jgi:diaminopimelate epimerase
VLDKEIAKGSYGEIANKILEGDATLEQVGFLKQQDNLFRLEMMGMEFCGNASRAFGCYLYHSGLVSSNEFNISSSGNSNLLKVNVRKESEHKYYSGVEIPFNKNYDTFIEKRDWNGVMVSVVFLEGITHILIDENLLPFAENKAKEILQALGFGGYGAVGVIWYRNENIKPVVWVKGTDTCYYENACGSGSIAFGLFLSQKSAKESFTIGQKNGETIEILISKTGDSVANASICGSTEIGKIIG